MASQTTDTTPTNAQLLIVHLVTNPDLAANLKVAIGHLHPTGQWHADLLRLAELLEQCEANELRELL